MSSVAEPKSLLKWLTKQLPSMIRTLESFVRAESPSTEKAAADACARLIAAEWRKRGVPVELVEQKRRGPHLRISWAPGKSKPRSQLLVLGHYDAAYATGTLVKRQFRTAAGHVSGTV